MDWKMAAYLVFPTVECSAAHLADRKVHWKVVLWVVPKAGHLAASTVTKTVVKRVRQKAERTVADSVVTSAV